MGDDSPESMSATGLLAAYRRRELSPADVVRHALRRIGDLDPVLNAVRALPVDEALAAASESESRWREGQARPLEGIPVLVKDLFDTARTPTSYGSAIFDGHVPTSDAAAVHRVRVAGGVVLAKTATHEFGWGITTESRRFGPTRNPWDTDRSPGGSSGGSAAGLAAGYAPLALGSDTAGSIRVPAAFCGVMGLKPTYGAVDVQGLRPLVESLDHVGPMARTVEDLALLWSSITSDASAPHGEPEAATVGVLDVSAGPAVASSVARVVATVAATLADVGYTTRPVSSPTLVEAYHVLRDTVLTGGLATHRRLGLWPEHAGEYGDDVRARLELAEQLGSETAERAQVARDAVRRAASTVFQTVDVLLSPVSAVAPALIGEQSPDYRDQVLTHIAPQSLAGLPALALRAGFDEDGLPVGVQLTAPAGREDRLLEVGAHFQRLSAHVQQRRPRSEPRPTRTTTVGGDPCRTSTEATTSPCRSAELRRTSTSTSVCSVYD